MASRTAWMAALLLLLLQAVAADVKLTGHIFIKGGEAESYEGITVEYIRGRKPVLTINENGKEREQVELEKYDSLTALHALFAEKGFHKKSGDETNVEKVKEKAKESMPLAARVERLGNQGEVIQLEGDNMETGPIQVIGYLTGTSIVGIVVYVVASRRTKNARAVV